MRKVVMPLDTGRISEQQSSAQAKGAASANESYAPDVHYGADIGQALKVVREYRKLSVEQVAEITRIRRAYLADIEAMRLDKLPSRPFTIGYIRAYAEALGLDAEAAVERFKAEEPVLDEPLRGPVGVGSERDPRWAAIVVGVVVILAAIIVWNVAQRSMTANAPPSPTAPAKAAAQALAAQKSGTFNLGAPLPAPVESTTPPLYVTPGMPDDGSNTGGGVTTVKPVTKADGEAAVDISKLSPFFVATAKIYGAPASQPSAVTLQAIKGASLIVRGADGSIYFARQFAPGEAYRAPQLTGLLAEVSEPTNFQVFVRGQSKGVLPAAQTSLTKLADSAPKPASPGPAPAPALPAVK
jgi:transcriptional regulator with XRE-family HTH domain